MAGPLQCSTDGYRAYDDYLVERVIQIRGLIDGYVDAVSEATSERRAVGTA